MPFTAQDAFGTVGLVLLLTGFVLNTRGRLSATSPIYHLLNLTGSGVLAVYSVLIEAWVFFPLEVVWAAVALMGLVRNGRALEP